MNLKTVTDTFSVSPQIRPDDLAEIKERGFTTVVCARPDGEDDGQPTFEEIKDAAVQAGLTAVHIPITPGQMTDDDVRRMDEVLSKADGPVLGYCRGGPRAETLYRATGR